MQARLSYGAKERTFFRSSAVLARKRSSCSHASFPACGATVRGRTVHPRLARVEVRTVDPPRMLPCTCCQPLACCLTRVARTYCTEAPGRTCQHSFPPWSVPPSSRCRWSSSAQTAWGRPWSRRKCARLPRCQSRRPTPYCPCRSKPCARPPERVPWVPWGA